MNTLRKQAMIFLFKTQMNLKKGKIDVAFIDGWHTYDQSLKDFKNCLNHLRKRCDYSS